MSVPTNQFQKYHSDFGIDWSDTKTVESTISNNNLSEPETEVVEKSIPNQSFGSALPGAVSSTMQPFSSYFADYDKHDLDSPDHKAQMTTWFWTPTYGSARYLNVNDLRRWGDLEVIQICVNKLVRRITRLEWDITFKEELDLSDAQKEQLEPQRKEIKNFFKHCNKRHEDVSSVLKQLLRDLYILDAGVIIKTFNRLGHIVEIQSSDGGTYIKNFDRFGMPPTIDNFLQDGSRIPAYYQYSIVNPSQRPIVFYDEEVSYFALNQQSYSIYGQSNVEILKNRTLRYLYRSGKWNAEFFERNMIPSAIVQTSGMNENQRRKLMQFWQTKVQGKDHKVSFIDGETMQIHQLQLNNKDMEFINGSKWFMNQVAQIFGLNPNAVGITDSVGSKNVSVDQSEQVNMDAIQPTTELIEKKLSYEIIPHFFSKPEKDTMGEMANVISTEEINATPFEFRFMITDTSEEQRKFNNLITELQNGLLTIDEYREMMGKKPIETDDDDSQDNDNDEDEDDADSEEDKDKDKSLSLATADKTADTEIKGASETSEVVKQDTPEFDSNVPKLDKNIQKYEDEYLGIYHNLDNMNKESADTILASYTKDNVKDNFRSINKELDGAFNTNLLVATGAVALIINSMYAKGYDNIEAVSKSNLNIPYSIDSVTTRDNLVISNVDLITNVSEDQRKNIIQTLQGGIDNNKSIKQIMSDLRPIIDSKRRAEAIARTEVLRTFTKSHDQAARDVGLFKYKMWMTAHDERVRCTHRPMDRQIKAMDKPFDLPSCGQVPAEKMMLPRTGSASNSINCRCTVNYYVTREDAEADSHKSMAESHDESLALLDVIDDQETKLKDLELREQKAQSDNLDILIKERELDLKEKEEQLNDKKARLIQHLEDELDV